ncbi:MAG: BRCT domain-containing protein [Methylobacter sp.]
MTHEQFLQMALLKDEAGAQRMMEKLNTAYRAGEPLLSDQRYDDLLAGFAEKFPHNSFFNQQEVESDLGAIEGKTVPLPERMLSTNKAYSLKEIEKWVNDVLRVAASLGMAEGDVFFRVTPKLDGFAAYDDGERLYTRGDGRNGVDITRVLKRGLKLYDDKARGMGPGEIVVGKAYFNRHLSAEFKNSRNFISAVIKEGEWDDGVKRAVNDGAAVFCPFSLLPCYVVKADDLMTNFDAYRGELLTCLFDVDGIVIECVNELVKRRMGHTDHHHRWQISYKKNEEYHDIKVTGLVWQTSKNGRITPVVELEPTEVSGVTISRATGHHAGNVRAKRIDRGAIVRVCRSGLVIPYIESVVKECVAVGMPQFCPSCSADTELDGDNLLCTNTETCPAQIERTIEFFFKTIGNCDGFGPKVIEKLCVYGAESAEWIYSNLNREDFISADISPGIAQNLVYELSESRRRPIEDWRFLAAFGIHNVGKGGCEKLLKHHRLKDVFSLTAEEIVRIDGFAEKTANSLVNSLANIKAQFDQLMSLGFNLIETPLSSERVVSSPIAGKTVVFTGSMQHGGRSQMEKQAKALGAKVASAVTGKTDYLVIGTNVGASKTEAAHRNGTAVISENDYLKLISN